MKRIVFVMLFFASGTFVWAQSPSPWTQRILFDQQRMNAELSRSLADYSTLTNSAYQYALLNALDTRKTDSISGTSPQVILTEMPAYYCGMPVADLVHHSIVWSPVVKGLTDYSLKASTSLSSDEKNKITKSISVAMNGLNFFVGRDRQVVETGKWAFYTRVPATCSNDQNYNGTTAPLNYISSAALLALELENFFSLPDNVVTAINARLGEYRLSYLQKMQSLRINLTNYVVSQLQLQSDGSYWWFYMPAGRPEDNSHAAETVAFFARLYELHITDGSYINSLIKTFIGQYSTGPFTTYSHLSRTYALANRGKYYATSNLSRWIDLLKKDCSLITKLNDLLWTEVPDDKGNLLKPGNYAYYAQKMNHARTIYCQ